MDLGVSGVFFAVAAEPLEGGQVATPRLPLRCGKQNAGGGENEQPSDIAR